MSNAAEGSYVADQYLPGDLSTWQRRIEDLIAELRRPDLQPCSGFLYRKEAGQPLQACIDGVINEMAIRGGVPGAWTEYTDADDENVIFWDIEQPDRGGEEPFGLLFTDAPTVAMPEALFYHGLDVQDGQHIIDIMQCDPTFIRSVINGRHGLAMGTATTVKTNAAWSTKAPTRSWYGPTS